MMTWMLLSKLFVTWCHLCAWMWMPVVARRLRFSATVDCKKQSLTNFVYIPIYLLIVELLGSFFAWGGLLVAPWVNSKNEVDEILSTMRHDITSVETNLEESKAKLATDTDHVPRRVLGVTGVSNHQGFFIWVAEWMCNALCIFP